MSWSDLFAFLAVVVAVLSAMYSRWSAMAAQRANEIATHNERLRIYRGLLNFRMTLTTRRASFPDEALWEFADFVLLSEFYFSERAHNEFQKLLDEGNQIKAMHEVWQHNRKTGQGDAARARTTTKEMLRKTKDRCGELIDMLKPDLRLEASKPGWLV